MSLDTNTLALLLTPVVILAVFLVFIVVAVLVMLILEGLSRSTNWIWEKITKRQAPILDVGGFIGKGVVTILLLFLSYNVLVSAYEVASKMATAMEQKNDN